MITGHEANPGIEGGGSCGQKHQREVSDFGTVVLNIGGAKV